MLILMKNPNHGAMYVYSETEAVRHEKLGWVRDVPEPVKPEPVSEPVAEPKAEPVKRSYNRKAV